MDWIWVIVVALRGASSAPGDRWALVLADLDRTRAVAFAEVEPQRLDQVYVRGSGVRSADAAMISEIRARGGRVAGAGLLVLSCRVLDESTSRVRLDVVDRLGAARIVWSDATTTSLPRDEPTRRIVTLDRTEQGWRIAGSEAVTPRR